MRQGEGLHNGKPFCFLSHLAASRVTLSKHAASDSCARSTYCCTCRKESRRVVLCRLQEGTVEGRSQSREGGRVRSAYRQDCSEFSTPPYFRMMKNDCLMLLGRCNNTEYENILQWPALANPHATADIPARELQARSHTKGDT